METASLRSRVRWLAASFVVLRAIPWPLAAQQPAVNPSPPVQPAVSPSAQPGAGPGSQAHLAVKSRKRLAGRPPDSGLSHLILRGIVRPSVILLQPCRIDQKRAAI